jgi:hypothetical protein
MSPRAGKKPDIYIGRRAITPAAAAIPRLAIDEPATPSDHHAARAQREDRQSSMSATVTSTAQTGAQDVTLLGIRTGGPTAAGG